jgi:hypothetical protein
MGFDSARKEYVSECNDTYVAMGGAEAILTGCFWSSENKLALDAKREGCMWKVRDVARN